MPEASISDIGQIIELAIAPVFLLAGLGGILNVVASRLSRVVDRVRVLERDVPTAEAELQAVELRELAILDRRLSLCHWSVALCTTAALLICLVVMILFVADLVGLKFAFWVSLLFIAAMASLTAGLLLFLLEVTIATRFVRVNEQFVTRTGSRDGS